MSCRSKKRCRALRKNIAPDPMVDAGNPSHRHETRTTPHPTRLRHRMVILAACPPSRSTTCPPQEEKATVMLAHQCPPGPLDYSVLLDRPPQSWSHCREESAHGESFCRS